MSDLDNVVFPGLKERVVVITGAGQDIGRVFAKAFAKAGARAVIAEINEDKAASVAAALERHGVKECPPPSPSSRKAPWAPASPSAWPSTR